LDYNTTVETKALVKQYCQILEHEASITLCAASA